MTPEEKAALDRQLEQLKEQLDIAKSEAGLSDAEKSLYRRLTPDAQRGFLRLDPAARRAEVAKTTEENPVVYTSETGEQFRKSDDPRLIRLAKQADENAKNARSEKEARETGEFEKRAEVELKNLPGTPFVKIALLRAVESIKDEAYRKGALALLKAGNEALAFEYDVAGIKVAAQGGAEGELEALAEKYAKQHNVSIVKARSLVLNTAEAAELVQRMRAGVQ